MKRSAELRRQAGVAWVEGWTHKAERLEAEAVEAEFAERLGKGGCLSGTAMKRREKYRAKG